MRATRSFVGGRHAGDTKGKALELEMSRFQLISVRPHGGLLQLFVERRIAAKAAPTVSF